MTLNHEQPDDLLPPALADELKHLFDTSITPETDRAVLDRAGPILARRRWIYRLQFAAPLAAAAAIALVVWLGWLPSGGPQLAGDIDGNGRVDILDALVLARGVQAGTASEQWDLNTDGVIDARDADAVAQQVVELTPESES